MFLRRNLIKILSEYPLLRFCRIDFASQKVDKLDNSLHLSDTCVKRLQGLCDNESFLRLSVEGGGCSGFQYKFDLDKKLAEDDRIFERDGVKVVIDEMSLQYVKGATVDFQTELIRSAFRVINNPNAEMGCSCGASFTIKID